MPEDAVDDSQALFELSIQETFVDVSRAHWLHRRSIYIRTAAVTLLIIAMTTVGIFARGSPKRHPGESVLTYGDELLLMSLVIGIFILILAGFWLGSWMRFPPGSIKWRITQTGFSRSVADTESFFQWSRFTNYKESRHVFLLYRGQEEYVSFPKRAMDSGQLEQFREILRATVGNTRYTRPEGRFPVLMEQATPVPALPVDAHLDPPAAIEEVMRREPGAVQFAFDFTREEYVRMHMPKSPAQHLRFYALQFLVFAATLGFVFGLNPKRGLNWPLATWFAVLIAASPWLTRNRHQAMWKKQNLPDEHREGALHSSGITYALNGMLSNHVWSRYSHYREFSRSFCLYLDQRLFEYIPKSAFASAEAVDAARRMFQQKIGRTRYVRPGRRRTPADDPAPSVQDA